MPKMKTHKATAKRVRVTATGKIVHKRAGAAHMLMKKSARRKRRMAILTTLKGVDTRRIKQLIRAGGE